MIIGLYSLGAPLHGFDLSQVERSVVRIFNADDNSMGSGTIINANGDVLTNQHVTSGSRALYVISEFSGGEKAAEIVWESSTKDLAVIRAPGLTLPPARLLSGEPEKGSPVFSLGYPGAADLASLALDVTVTSGVLGRIFSGHPVGWEVIALQHDAEISLGNSGGPLFDGCGRVIGINTAGPRQTTPGVNWSSHIAESIGLLRARNVEFLPDDSPCVATGGTADPSTAGAAEEVRERDPAAESQAGAAKEEAQQAREKAEKAEQDAAAAGGQAEAAKEEAQQAREKAEKAEQDAVAAGGQAEAAKEEAQQAQEKAEKAEQDAAAASRQVEEVHKRMGLQNTFVILLSVLTLLALGLALRKPRQALVRVAGDMLEPLSRMSRQLKHGLVASDDRTGATRIALAGFDKQGRPVKILLRHKELDREQGGFTLGRHHLLVDKTLDDKRVSRRHVRFSCTGRDVFIEDLNSSNGTTLNGTQCFPFKPVKISPGDMVDIGGIELRVSG